MEDALGVYGGDHDDGTALVCADETSKRQTKETRAPLPARPGRPAGFDFDYECERNGTANLFMLYAPLDGWRHVKVTDRRTRRDFARVLKDLADVHFPGKRIVPVMDNLNTHRLSTLYDTFEPEEEARLAGRFEVRHTPKHGSWLNVDVAAKGSLDRVQIRFEAVRGQLDAVIEAGLQIVHEVYCGRGGAVPDATAQDQLRNRAERRPGPLVPGPRPRGDRARHVHN